MNTPPTIAVRVNQVLKHFGEGEARIDALKDACFEAHQGELIMIVGPSGCGKTTLLSVIAGTLHIDRGAVEVFNQPLHQMPVDEITDFRGKNIGFIFQQFNLIPTLTVQENTAIPLLIQKQPQKKAFLKAGEILTQVGLGNRLRSRPSDLSTGQQQRVAIARALVHEPRLIICDEPTASLDAENGRKIMNLLKTTAQSPHRCVIVVTHDNRIFEFADRIAQMEDGQVKRIQTHKPFPA